MALSGILVGTDERDEAAAAAAWAARVARGHGARLEFFEAAPGSAEQSPTTTEALQRATRARIAHWLEPLGASVEPSIVVQHGEPLELLTARAQQTAPDLVVVGSRPTEGTTDLAIGSLAHALAHHLSTPLVTVPVRDEVGGDWIVVGVDGSAASRTALRWSVELAGPMHARVCAVYAFDDLYGTFTPNGPLGHDEAGARREVRSEAARSDVEFVERPAAHPADALREVATARAALLVVVAARQRGSIGGLLLGATPDRLLHRPPGPVAVLPHRYVERRSAALAHRDGGRA